MQPLKAEPQEVCKGVQTPILTRYDWKTMLLKYTEGPAVNIWVWEISPSQQESISEGTTSAELLPGTLVRSWEWKGGEFGGKEKRWERKR